METHRWGQMNGPKAAKGLKKKKVKRKAGKERDGKEKEKLRWGNTKRLRKGERKKTGRNIRGQKDDKTEKWG